MLLGGVFVGLLLFLEGWRLCVMGLGGEGWIGGGRCMRRLWRARTRVMRAMGLEGRQVGAWRRAVLRTARRALWCMLPQLMAKLEEVGRDVWKM
jgi:hypothetical protein